MSKRYIKESSGGGIEITMFLESVPSNHGLMEIEESELFNKNIDKCRIDKNGKVYEDNTVFTKKEEQDRIKDSSISKLKLLGLSEQEIKTFLL